MKSLAATAFLSALAPAAPAAALQQGGGGGMTQGAREAMWPAPTAEDWAKPCLIHWQRTWEDAQAVSRETNRPILICTNMDGEIASEHYAGIRYRQPDIAALYEPYVAVIASTYRHNPRDHDEDGNRILCPRFGHVTCGEHISIEPGLFAKYFEGDRVAPRHIMIELDGKETYDVYYAFDTDSVFDAIRDGMQDRPDAPPFIARGDRSIIERVASRDNADQVAVEQAYRDGDRETRRALLEAALARQDATSVDLLRMAVFGLDLDMSQLARQGLTQTDAVGARDLIVESLRAPMESGERDGLIGALERLGDRDPRSRMLSNVHRGLSGSSDDVDVNGWSAALAAASEADRSAELASQSYARQSRLRAQDEVLAGSDGAAQIELAEAFFARAVKLWEEDPKYARLLLMDARKAGEAAERSGLDDWRVDAVLGLTAFYQGEKKEAHVRAESAAAKIPSGATSWNAMAVLGLFAEARWADIHAAVVAKKDWPTEWVQDVHAAYSVLASHPLGTDAHVAAHYDFLKGYGAPGQAASALDRGLRRFSDSEALHGRWRSRILRERGRRGLETAYDSMLQSPDVAPIVHRYAGYAALVAAEFRRRSGDAEAARSAYDRGIAYYEKHIELDSEDRDTDDHYIAMALAGKARMAMEAGDHEVALSELLSSFERRQDSAATLDGLNLSAVDTAKMLLQRLREAEKTEMAQRLQDALNALDPVLLELPAYEGKGGPSPDLRRRARRGDRGAGGNENSGGGR